MIWVPYVELGSDEALFYDGTGATPSASSSVTFWAMPHPIDGKALEVLSAMTALEVLQLSSSGIDHVAPLLPDTVMLCNAPHLRAASTAEVAICLILVALNDIRNWLAVQRARSWTWLDPRRGLDGRTVLLVGYGEVGRAIHRRLAGFEIEVLAVAAREQPGVIPVRRLREVIPQADVIVAALPLYSETARLFDAKVFALMQPGTLFVNVSRGEIVDTSALLAALHSGHISAALDVTDPEPLPDAHPLWTAPGVIISPHMGGNFEGLHARARAYIAEQIGRYSAGEPLRFVVEPRVRARYRGAQR